MPKLANFQVVSGISVRPPEQRISRQMCVDMRQCDRSRELLARVPEIAELGSNVSAHACGDGVLNRALGIVLLATAVGTEETHSLRIEIRPCLPSPRWVPSVLGGGVRGPGAPPWASSTVSSTAQR